MAPHRANQRRRQLGAPIFRLLLSGDIRSPHAAVGVELQRIAEHHELSATTGGAARRKCPGNTEPAVSFPHSGPTQRQSVIDTLIQNQGLPANLSGPVNLYSQQILLTENVSATVGMLGARNSLFLNLFYLRQEPISGSGTALPPILARHINNTRSRAQVSSGRTT